MSGKARTSNEERFWTKVSKDDGCWLWLGSLNFYGYGQFYVTGEGMRLAHRVSYELAYGKFDSTLYVLHRCDRPLCVNPTHLFLGTAKDNALDMAAKGRAYLQKQPEKVPRGESHGGAKLTDASVRDIRQRYKTGTESITDLSRRFDVARSLIFRVIRRKSWAHIEDDLTA